MRELLDSLYENKSLSFSEAKQAMEKMTEGNATPEHISALLSALKIKGETYEEIAGFAAVLREKSIPVLIDRDDLIDTCGTGGTHKNTFNISTTVAFVLAAAGVGVAKHGNRSISSKCGSADVLEELGISLAHYSIKAKESLEKFNFAFLFAPNFHPAFKHIGPIRKALGFRTVFNILGPLVNPAQVKRQVLGVFTQDLLETMARSLKELGTIEAMVVASDDGFDEFSLGAKTKVSHLKDNMIENYEVDPQKFGLKKATVDEIKGGDKKLNAKIIQSIIDGQQGPHRDIVLLNAAASFVVSNKARDFKEGIQIAKEVIDSGKVSQLVKDLRNFR